MEYKKTVSDVAQELSVRFIGTHNIALIAVRDAANPYIKVTFDRSLDASIRREIEQHASPYKVKFTCSILRQRNRYVEK